MARGSPQNTQLTGPALAEEVLSRVNDAYEAARSPRAAAPMAAYMRNQFSFLGIASPARAQLDRGVLAGLPAPDQPALTTVAEACWERPEREYQYFATKYVRRHVRRCGSSFLAVLADLVTTKSWWDTVDELAAHGVGPLVAADRRLVGTMRSWARGEQLWLARAAILHQLTYRERTDEALLFELCLARAADPDFFARKAIGWALRAYAHTDPAAVARFLGEHGHQLSTLSYREAAKHLGLHGR